jgi:hypothetical protein
MKKNSIYALMSAIALAGAIGFSSCSSTEDDVTNVNPGYDPATGEVPVEFSFSVSTANTSTTRMSSAATQATTNDAFRGINNSKLFTFKQDVNGRHLYDPSATILKRYDLSQVVMAGQIDADNSRRVLEMSLPLNTNTLLFYGKATVGAQEGSLSLENSYGHLDTNAENSTAEHLSDFTISVSRRLTDAENYKKTDSLLAGVLTCIMNTDFAHSTDIADLTVAGHPDNDNNINAYGFDVEITSFQNIKWSSYAYTDDTFEAVATKSPLTPANDLAALEKMLGDAYRQMVSIRGDLGELRAASGTDILRMITDLWSVVNKVRCAAPFNKEEAVAKYLAVQIFNNIDKFFNANGGKPEDGGPVSGVVFEAFSNVRSHFLSSDYWPVVGEHPDPRAGWGLNGMSDQTLADFPGSFGLPVGAAHIVFDPRWRTFSYPSTFNASGMGDQNFTVNDYFYSPELIYFGNSPIRVSDTEHRPTDYPQGAKSTTGGWDADASWTADWKSGENGHVTASTRSVAMQYDINYGTALLETKVKYGTNVLKDNNHAVQKAFHPEILPTEEPDKEITVNSTSFQLVGITVGGQSKNVGWDFLPKKVDATYEYGFVYDAAIPDGAKTIPAYGSTSQPNYTLLFDNYDASKGVDDQNAVYVALELLNNTGQSFYGNFNVIPNGGTFYIIGKLDPSATYRTAHHIAKPVWPTYHKLPPYDNSGNSIEAVRVFMQDYMTKATFVIGENSLKYAYLTVPDLRASTLTLGLSVNIEWSAGLDFGDVELGNN